MPQRADSHELYDQAYWASIGQEYARESAEKQLLSLSHAGGEPDTETSPRPRLPPFPLVAVRDLAECSEQDWLIEKLLPCFDQGSAGYIFGPEKTRKSLLLADIALSVVTGTPALGRFEVKHPGVAVGFFAEDAKGETSRRVHRMARARGLEVPEQFKLIDVPELSLDDNEHQQRLMRTLSEINELRFVWLDPMVRLHRVDDNRANELAPIHTFLRRLSRACPQAVLALSHHANKQGGSRGSTDFPAFGDFNLFLRRVDEHTSEVFRIDNRGGPPGEPFRYRVEDGYCEAGPTMSLVVDDCPVSQPDSTEPAKADLKAAITEFKSTNPGASQKKCGEWLRGQGMRIRNDALGELWRSV